MSIYAYDPYVDIKKSYVVQEKSLHKMLDKIDVLLVCVHLNNKTYRFINNSVFEGLKEGSYFINTSRGEVVDEDAFIKNLKNGKIKAAGVDVISEEITKPTEQHPLVKYCNEHDNLIITPHIAGLTYDSEKKAQVAAYNAIKNMFKNKNKRG